MNLKNMILINIRIAQFSANFTVFDYKVKFITWDKLITSLKK